MLKAVIIDDEQHCIDVLQTMLGIKCNMQVEVVATANSVDASLQILNEYKPALIFLDVEMPGGSGITLLDQLNYKPAVVFTTAHEKYALGALKQQAIDYLLKPIDVSELMTAVSKAEQYVKANESLKDYRGDKQIGLSTGKEVIMAYPDDIVRIEAQNNYAVIVFTNGRRELFARTLKYFEDQLPMQKFYRIHHSHLVNISKITGYDNSEEPYAYLNNGDKVEIARRRKAEFNRFMNGRNR